MLIWQASNFFPISQSNESLELPTGLILIFESLKLQHNATEHMIFEMTYSNKHIAQAYLYFCGIREEYCHKKSS